VGFGMGVQINAIYTVIHWVPSKSPTSYWQEVGRTGRDGLPSRAVLYQVSTYMRSSFIDDGMKEVCRALGNSSVTCIRQAVLQSCKLCEVSYPDSRSVSCTCYLSCHVADCMLHGRDVYHLG